MKRGFILAMLSLFIVITFGGFGAPEKGHAVAPYSDKTIQDWYTKGVNIFDTEIVTLQNNPSTTEPQTTAALIKLNKYYKSVFVDLYNNKTSTPDKAKTAYTTTVDTIVQSLTTLSPNYRFGDSSLELNNTEINLLKSDYGKSVITTIKNVLTFSSNSDVSPNSATANNEATAQAAMPNATPEQRKAINDSFRAPEGSGCTTILTSSITDCVVAGFNWFIQHTLLTIGGWFLTMGGFLLDWSISSGILNFKQWVPDQITGLWKLVRDVLYLCIVFIGFYLAFMYIIGRDEKFKKFIPWLIIFALFVNFSLPITRAMIDMSNIVALNIYNSAVPDASTGAGTAIMNKIGLSTLLMDQSKNTPTIAVSLLSVIFVFFAAWVFFQVAILMMIRTVTLTLCLICSPFLLIDSLVTIPAFGEHVKKIRSIFFNQLFMADVFMIIFFITLQVMNVLKPKEAITNAALASTGVGNIGLIFGIFMMMILLHFMLKITKSMSGEVGSFATGMVNNGVGLLAGGAMGVGAMAGRASIGRLAAKARDSSWVKNNQDSFLGRKAYDFSHSVASSSMDARNSGVAQKFSSATKMNLGKGGNVGYQQNLDNTIKDRAERMNRIDTKTEEGRKAKERFQEKAGGVVGLAVNKDKVRTALGDSEKDLQKEALSKYKALDDDKDREEFLTKQNKETQEKITAYKTKIETEKQEKTELKELNKNNAASNVDMAAAMKSIAEQLSKNQPSQNSKINNFDEAISNKNSQTKINIDRGGAEKTTNSGIILPA